MEPSLYIKILEQLHILYFEQQKYEVAFRRKQEKLSVEQQFGLRAFIGAGPLRAKRSVNSKDINIAQEIRTSVRYQDIVNLVEKISQTYCKLIILHGESGVGKSSILEAGLVPALRQEMIVHHDVIPVLVRNYKNWVKEIGNQLSLAIEEVKDIEYTSPLKTMKQILNELKKNDDRNLMVVFLFDQFEEFFFENPKLEKRLQFYKFCHNCFEDASIPFVKIIFSLREDYLHYLFECEEFVSSDAIEQDILGRKIRYRIKNFTVEDAKLLIKGLTENSRLYWQEDLINKVVHDLAKDSNEVRPIELQIVGTQLQEEKVFSASKYDSKETCVKNFLNNVIKDCGECNKDIAQLTLYFLTDENYTRPVKTFLELTNDLKAIEELDWRKTQLELVLKIFVGAGLVFLIPDESAKNYQLIHDYIVPLIRKGEGNKILKKIDYERQERIRLKQLEEQKLAREIELAREEQKRRKKQIIFAIGVAIVFAALLVIALWSGWRATRAEQQAKIKAIETLTTSSYTQFLSNDDLGALITIVKASLNSKDLSLSPSLASEIESNLQSIVYGIKEKNRLEAHKAFVTAVDISPNGEIIASGDDAGSIRLWSLKDGHRIAIIDGHAITINCLCFSLDGKILISGGLDGTLKLWDVQKGTIITTLSGHLSAISSIAFSPNGKMFASGSWDRTIKLWNIDTKSEIRTLEGHTGFINSIDFSPGGIILASGSHNGEIKIWTVTSKYEIASLPGHTGSVNSVRFGPDGNILASGGEDWIIRLWNLEKKEDVEILKGHVSAVKSLAFSPDGNLLASGSDDTTIKLWSMEHKDEVETLKGHLSSVNDVRFSPKEPLLVSGSSDRTIRIWNISRNRIVSTFQAHSESINDVVFSKNGEIFASASNDGIIKLWNTSGSNEPIRKLSGHLNAVLSIRFSPNGSILASGSRDQTIKFWNVVTGQELQTLVGHSASVSALDFNPEGNLLASAGWDCVINIWNFEKTGKEHSQLQGHSNIIDSICFSPDGKLIASGSWDSTVRIWNVETGNVTRIFQDSSNPVYNVAFSPDGKILASGSQNGIIKLLNPITGDEISTLQGHSSHILRLVFSPDGTLLASGSADNTIKIWSVKDNKELKTLLGHFAPVHGLSFHPDGKLFVSGSANGLIKIWDLEKLLNLDVNTLLIEGCEWLYGYLKTNPNVSEDERGLCDEILTE